MGQEELQALLPAAPSAEAAAPAFNTGLDDHRLVLKAWFARRLGSPQDAEDYVQEVFARALATQQPKNIDNPRGFLLRIASTVLVDRYRRDKVRERHNHVELNEAAEAGDGGHNSPERVLAARQQLALVQAALLDLDPLPRQIFVLARLEGLSHREIGARLGIEPVQVGRQIERAVAHLARRLVREAS